MALIEMDFATGGGEHYEETVLWTNPNPSAYLSSQLITLSDDYTQYDLIKVVFKCASSGADDSKRYIRNVYQTPEDIQNTQNAVNYACAGLGRRGSSTSICDFIGIGTSNTNVNYYHLDTANLIIPLSIYGIKKVGGKDLGYMSYGEVNTEAIITSLTVNCDVGDYITMATASAWTSGTGSSGIGKDDITVQGGDILVSDIGTQSSWPNGSSYWYSKNRLLIVRATSTTVTFSVTSTSGQYKMLRPVWTVSKIV